MALTTTLGDSAGTAARVAAQLEARSDVRGRLFKFVLAFGLALTLAILVALVIGVVTDGWSVLTTRFSSFLSSGLRSSAGEAGVRQGLQGTFWIAIMVTFLAFPVGIGAAIYMEEYAPKNRLSNFIDVNIRNLAGVPSVVYGILGLTIFVGLLKRTSSSSGGNTLLAGGLTLAVLVLPIVIITSAEAIRAVPSSIREGAYGVGATKWETIRHHVLPYAAPGVLTGTLLSLSRAVGEAAPLILVGAVTGRLGGSTGFFEVGQFGERFTAMPIVIATWATRPQEEFSVSNTAAAIVVLLVFVLILNSAAILLRNRFERKRSGR